ncbi:hypothetical protein BC629DRAFT_291461 [Irpex lacteus]|nr:hypothetical protein BC629DRAFT_291461 [Irpex lacteus]
MSVTKSQSLIHQYFTSTTQPNVGCEQNSTSCTERPSHLREADEAAQLAERHWQLHRTLLDEGGRDDEDESSSDSEDSFNDIWNILNEIDTLAGCPKVASTHKRGDLALKLRAILEKWRAGELEDAPTKLLYLLDGTYPKEELRASALQDSDVHKVALFRTLADQIGLRVGLVAIENTKWGVEYEDEEFANNHDMEETTVECFVDMSGRHVSDTLEDYEEATFPDWDTLCDHVGDGPYVEEEMESNPDYGTRTVMRLTQRAALVIWPTHEDFSVLYTGDDAIAKAAADVKAITSRHASIIENDLVASLLERAEESPKLIAQAVCQVAVRWRRVSLWKSAIEDCCQDGVTSSLLSAMEVFDAIQSFGLDSIQQELDLALDRDPHNASRWELLNTLSTLLANLPDDNKLQIQSAPALAWAARRISQVPKTLRVPVRGEERVLVDIAKANGGIEFLQDPKTQEILLLADDDFLRDFASAIHTAFPDSPEKSSLISSLLTAAIAKAPFTLIHPESPANNTATQHASDDSRLARAKAYLQTAHALGNAHLLDTITDRVMDTKALSSSQLEDYTRLVILPLMVFTSQDAQIDNDLRSRVGSLQKKGVDVFLSFLRDERNHGRVTQLEVATFLDAALVNNDRSIFAETIFPQLQASPLSPTILQFLVEELTQRKRRFAALTVGDISPTLTQQFLERVDLKKQVNIIRALDLCVTAEALDLCDDVITKCLSNTVATPEYIEEVLIPLLPELRTWADRHDRNMDVSVRAIVIAWLERVLGPQPAPDPLVANQLTSLSAWSCECQPCVDARTFLIKGEEDSTTLDRIGMQPRRHVEGFLGLHAARLASWVMLRTKPQSLKITRSDVLLRLIRWRRKQAKGIAFLKDLASNERELKRILGPEYERIKSTLVPQMDSPSTAPLSESASTPRPLTQGDPPPSVAETGARRARAYSKTRHEPLAKKGKFSVVPTVSR